MFTGIIETVGTVREVTRVGKGIRLAVLAPELLTGVEVDESISVNGACLTVTEVFTGGARFDVVPETVERTNLKSLQPGARVNLERALRPTDRLGGHFVQGHVDGVGSLISLEQGGKGCILTIQAPQEVMDHLVGKGSVAVNGVSLTVARMQPDRFSVAVIPHTLKVTTLGQLKPGDQVNLEVDILGKYVAQQLDRYAGQPEAQNKDERLLRLLREEGFTSQ